MTQRVVNYTYATGNPVLPDGSIDVRDGIDNLQSMDVFMNAPEDTYNQRDGNVVRTVAGMNNEFDTMIVDMNSEFDGQILNMGFTRIGTFATGATLLNGRQTLLWDIADGGDGQEYGWSGSFLPSGKVVPPGSTPASTGGISVGAWISRFDPELRIQLRENTRRSYANSGYNLVAGSFETGGTLNSESDVLVHDASGIAYSGSGPFPQTIPPGTDPNSAAFTGRHNSLSAVFYTVSDMKKSLSGAVYDGNTCKTLGYYSPGDGGGAEYVIHTGGTADGYIDHAIYGGFVARLQHTNIVDARQCGLIVGSGPVKNRPSMSDVLDNISAYFAPDYTSTVRRPNGKTVEINLGDQPFRITRPFYQPAFTIFRQQSAQTLAWDGISKESTDGAFIYADWDGGEKDCAWNYAGWWLIATGSAAVGDRLNPFKALVGSSHYNNGYVTLTYGCDSTINIFTDKYIGCALNVTASTTSKFRLQCSGFLHPVMGMSCWGVNGDYYALSHHTGGYYYNCNSWKISGYSNYIGDDVNAPILGPATVPAGWYTHPVHNPDSLAYSTTGIMLAYSDGFTTNTIITEGWNRARWGENNKGIVEIAPYSERIGSVGIHCVNTEIIQIGGVRSLSAGALGYIRATGTSNVVIDMPADGGFGVNSWDGGSSVDPVYQRSNIEIRLGSPLQVTQPFSKNIRFSFINNVDGVIYCSDTGLDTNCGLNTTSPVRDVAVALARAEFYGIKTVSCDSDGNPVGFGSAFTLKNDVTFTSYGTGKAQLNSYSSGATVVSIVVNKPDASIIFDNINVLVAEVAAPSGTSKGMIQLFYGNQLRLTVSKGDVTTGVNSGLLVAGVNGSHSNINFAANGGTITGKIGKNAGGSPGQSIVMCANSSHAALFESSFRVL